jgi:hypothetical protein
MELFPKIKKVYYNIDLLNDTKDFREKGRLGSESNFDKYFNFINQIVSD